MTKPLYIFAAGGSLVDLDATVFIQLGIFALLFFLLRPLLFQPVLRLLEARRVAIAGATKEAAQLQAKAADMSASIAASLDEAREDAKAARAKIIEEARRRSVDIIRQVHESCARATEAARVQRDQALESVRVSLHADVDALACAAVSRILGRKS